MAVPAGRATAVLPTVPKQCNVAIKNSNGYSAGNTLKLNDNHPQGCYKTFHNYLSMSVRILPAYWGNFLEKVKGIAEAAEAKYRRCRVLESSCGKFFHLYDKKTSKVLQKSHFWYLLGNESVSETFKSGSAERCMCTKSGVLWWWSRKPGPLELHWARERIAFVVTPPLPTEKQSAT